VAAIGELTREHDVVVGLISEVRAAYRHRNAPVLAALARSITAVLEPHTAVEERGLFPAMAVDFPDEVAALHAEHRRVEAVLGEAARGTPADPTWPDRLLATAEMLREHILKEQDGVFPAALATLRPEQWDAVDAVRAGVGSVLPAATA
jgi:hemerythrin-like domain-containing protein